MISEGLTLICNKNEDLLKYLLNYYAINPNWYLAFIKVLDSLKSELLRKHVWKNTTVRFYDEIWLS